VRWRRAKDEPRLALRHNAAGTLADVVVRDVSMFRAEVVSDRTLWLCCYLPGTGVEHDRVTFWVEARRGRLTFGVSEWPSGDVSYEPGSLTPGGAS